MELSKLKRAVIALVLTVISAAMLALGCCAADKAATNAISSIMFTKNLDFIEVNAVFTEDYVRENKGKTIYLFEIAPWQSASQINSMEPVAEAKLSESVTFKLPYSSSDTQRRYSKFLAATLEGSEYSIITGARYIDNISALAAETYDFPKSDSKKGLQIQLFSDAQILGISHTVINVPINEFVKASNVSGGTISYLFANRSFYFDKERIELLDHELKLLTDAGVNVYLNLMLTAPTQEQDPALDVMYYNTADPNAVAFAYNVNDQTSVLYLQSFTTFLAERYTRSDREHGFAGGYIFGYEVNSNRSYNSLGESTLDNYLNKYTVAFRIVDTSLRSVYSNGRTYISIANNFNALCSDINITPNENFDYPARALLENFNSKIAFAGNIPWRVAINPYPTELSNTGFWNDSNAGGDLSTQYVTMKNIDVLCELLSQDAMLYNGEKRSILISEFGVSADPSNEAQLKLQAAAYSYAYYKAHFNPMIEAIIYHRQVDNVSESNLWFGLWTRQSDTARTPLSKKPIYNVFKYIDTQRSYEFTEDFPASIGAKSWSDLIPGFDQKQLTCRTIYETIPVLRSEIESSYSDEVLFDFSASGGLLDFYPSDNSEYVELRSENDAIKLYSRMLSSAYSGEYKGVSRVFSPALELSHAGYITITLMAEAPADVTSVNIMLRLYKASDEKSGAAVYEGVAQLKPNEWTELTFKLDQYSSKALSADGLKLWMKSFDDKEYEGDFGLWIGQVILHEKGSFTILKVICWALVIVILLVAAAFGAIALRNRIRLNTMRRRRAEYERQQRMLANRQNSGARRSPSQYMKK